MWDPSQSNKTAFWGRKTLLKLDLSTGCVGAPVDEAHELPPSAAVL